MSSPAPGAKEAYRWKERRIGWEIHVGDYGSRLRVGSVEKKGGGRRGLRCLIDTEKLKQERERSSGSEEDDRGQLTLKLHVQ